MELLRRLDILAAATLLAGVVWLGQPAATARAAACTWDGATGQWTDATHWSCGAAPGAGDGATIAAGVVTVNAMTTIESLTLSGGELQLIYNLTVSDNIDWTGGVVSAAPGRASQPAEQAGALGMPFLTNQGTLELFGAGAKALNGAGLLNTGQANLESAAFSLGNGALFDNGAAGTFRVNGNYPVGAAGTGPNTFTNRGMFEKATEPGAATIDAVFNNRGAVQVTNGTLVLNGGGAQSGSFTYAANTTLSIAAGTYQLDDGASFAGAGKLDIAAGVVIVNGNVPVSNLNLMGGAVGGLGTLVLTGSGTWSGGEMGEAGTTLLGTGATLNVTGPSAKTLDARTFDNYGTFNLDSDQFFLSNQATFNNHFDGAWHMQGDHTVHSTGATPNVFHNFGVVHKDAGPGAAFFAPAFDNGGQVEVNSGSLGFAGGGNHTGGFMSATNAIVAFAGGEHILGRGAGFTGPGWVDVTGGALVADFGVTIANLDFQSGTVAGLGALILTGNSTWSGGVMAGMGATAVNPGATLTVQPGTHTPTLEQRPLRVAGTLRLNGALTLGNGATLTNLPAGQVIIDGDVGLNVTGIGQNVVQNQGLLVKNSGAGSSTIQPVMNNTGTVRVNNGVLQLNGAGVHSGQFAAEQAGTLTFLGGSHVVNAGTTFTGLGAVVVNGATLTVNANMIFGNLTLQSGALGGPGRLTFAGMTRWEGGVLGGTGEVVVPVGGNFYVAPGPDPKVLTGRTVENAGSMVFASELFFDNGTTLLNQAPGTLELCESAYLHATGAAPNTIVNQGTLVSCPGATTATVEPEVRNSGMISVFKLLLLKGRGVHGGGSQQTARAAAAYAAVFETFPGSQLTFADSDHLLSGGVVFSGTGTVAQIGGSLALSGSLDIASSFVRESGFFTAGVHPVNFIGSGVQTLTLQVPTTLADMHVFTGAVVVEGAAANNVLVTGALVNQGVLRKTLAVPGAGALTFGLTQVQVDVTAPGTLTLLRVDRIDANHPGANPAIAGGRYWTITPTGAGYTADLTLPHSSMADALSVCRYTGTGPSQDCARGVTTPATVTRAGITAFSDWAVEARPLVFLPTVLKPAARE